MRRWETEDIRRRKDGSENRGGSRGLERRKMRGEERKEKGEQRAAEERRGEVQLENVVYY